MKKLFVFSFVLAVSIQPALADVIFTSTSNHYGKITSITKTSITINEGCTNIASQISWDRRTSVIFNDRCYAPSPDISGSPKEIQFKCNKTSMFFIVKLTDVNSTFYCNSVFFDGNNFEFVLYDGRRFTIQDFAHNKNIDYLSYSKECTDSIKPPEIVPNSLQQLTAKLIPIDTTQPTPPSSTVKLNAPLNNAELINQFIKSDGQIMGDWRFSWFPCPGATKYQLYVIGIKPNFLNNPLINDSTITTTTYLYNRGPVILFKGWKWSVRAYVGGHWGEWSETRTFEVKPMNSIITGHIFGPLQGEYISDVGGERHKVKMSEVFLLTTDGKVVKKARLHGREYFFDNVPTGKTYWIYPDSRFNSTPPKIVISNIVPQMYERMNLTITGVKSDG